jgi:hypothetical protein
MRILFHDNGISNRGTTVAILDYAKYNQELLGHESCIIHKAGPNNDSSVLEYINKNYPVYSYTSLSELYNICDRLNIDVAYFIKYGFNDNTLSNPPVRNVVHAVFQAYQPHGDRYAYVSEWLSNKMSGGQIPYIPHIVNLPLEKQHSYIFNKGKIVLGRYGGNTTFDIPFVKDAVREIVEKYDDFIFVFVNTDKFYEHKNIIYLDPILELQGKTDFILSCDVMLHARERGESFGLAVAEFLFHNKPVLSWAGGTDQHHVDMLKETGTLYTNKEDLIYKILSLRDGNFLNKEYKYIVDKFSPDHVMRKFHDIFLK